MPEPGFAHPLAAANPPAAGAAVRPAPSPAPSRTIGMLHILNGDTAAERLRAAGIAGAVTLSADLLYEGPVSSSFSPERFRRARARFLAESGYEGYDECLARLTGWERDLEGFRAHDEVVLWFEHDLFDQLHLCRLLAWFAARDTGLTRLSLVQAADYLGRLPPQQMSGLLDTRTAPTAAQLRLAQAAWTAFCAPSPVGLESLRLRADTTALPYLGAALLRHLEEFPGRGDGLARTDRQALLALEAGPLPFGPLFAAVQRTEERIFMADLSLLRRLRDLAGGPRPLLRLDPLGGPRNPTATLTDLGRAVLAGREDWIALRGNLDHWLGGVHLTGRDAAWRWDRTTQRLLPAHAAGPGNSTLTAPAWPPR